MSWEIFSLISAGVTGMGMSLALMGALFIGALFIGFLILGLDFKYSLAFIMPAILGLVTAGIFPVWVSIIFWIFVGTLGIFLLYSLLSNT